MIKYISEPEEKISLELTGDAKKDLRLAYEICLEVDKLPMDHKESSTDMMLRVGNFIWSLDISLKVKQDQIFIDNSLVDGVVPARYADLAVLDRNTSLVMSKLSFALQSVLGLRGAFFAVMAEMKNKSN